MKLMNHREITVPAKGGGPQFRTGMSGVERIDVRGLELELRREVEGEVRFDAGSRALYATDASNFRQPPIGVVIPRTIDDVVAIHRVCREYRAPILSRGCGTSLSGETVNFALATCGLTTTVFPAGKMQATVEQPGGATPRATL